MTDETATTDPGVAPGTRSMARSEAAA